VRYVLSAVSPPRQPRDWEREPKLDGDNLKIFTNVHAKVIIGQNYQAEKSGEGAPPCSIAVEFKRVSRSGRLARTKGQCVEIYSANTESCTAF
jgi:hypothetical protein